MSGIYIHIPFCRQACHYCDFHFSTNFKTKTDLVVALSMEMQLRSEEIMRQYHRPETLYFGGGTPSILSHKELSLIFESLHDHFDLSDCKEITFEANPEDITQSNLNFWLQLGINRLSLGIQSFQHEKLNFTNRNHDPQGALSALELIQQYSFKNVTADLIFGIPPFELEQWKTDLNQLISFEIPHLSIYGLTIEPRTVFGNWQNKGKLIATDEALMECAFRLTHELLKDHNYEHYEISNYAKKGHESLHNSAYWEGKVYLGLGPGAHSFDGKKRSYNVSNNAKYIQSIQSQSLPSTHEQLTDLDRLNETVFTQLRTKKGLDLSQLKSKYGKDLLHDYSHQIEEWQHQGLIIQNNNNLKLTLDGMLLADEISLKMFYG